MKFIGLVPPAKHGPRKDLPCAVCGGATTLTRREAHPTQGPGYELQNYTCRSRKCGHVSQIVVETPGALQGKTISGADRVREWFAPLPGRPFCTDCIVLESGVERRIVVRQTKRMGETTLGSKYKARCSLCGELKTITVLNRRI